MDRALRADQAQALHSLHLSVWLMFVVFYFACKLVQLDACLAGIPTLHAQG